jgi:Domain of unknown function (DUF4267)
MVMVLAALLGAFLSLIGVALIASPFAAVQAFGIDPSHMADIGLAPAMGTRELAIGLAIIALAAMRRTGALGAVLLIASIVPVGDYWIAGKAVGYAAAWRHLVTLPFSLVLGLALIGRAS